ncbi:MAG: lipid asymmetry maintenance ABC transporter permease subunit MlaE [Gammaproteobacteria bacterium]|nr:lipid asymmetry maintenance ABC transporter permease subunit MlaE [Gammaproteobacteria bacterium]MCW8909518.1 lipid asymmetry maintenance ABC transporter permease subunit MlaE [Gammaproteobacteria bacterium]MCW9004399.1 lipid asymmetry maintenance ABC transporter permease subunit MlaE [Gammaproteobacteria bacterium]MCW9055812.1 lipid asymmetry maintenance ABC transporter permease subunit MlaE [Gammaproteobacteria bacterium]
MLDKLQLLGQKTLDIFARTGRGGAFLLHILYVLPATILRPALVIRQLYYVGVQTLVIIVVAGLFVGMVMALQSYIVLVDFGAEESISLMVALSIMRELGPVFTGLLFAGRAGSALTAEIGLMKSTEQLSGMEMMAVDPMKYVIAPRFLAGVISVPLLTAIFMAVAILGGYFVAVELLQLYDGFFWSQLQNKVDFYEDLLNGMIKSVVFGFVIVWIAVFEGHDCLPTSEGLGQATTRTVVHGSLAVLGLDFILTAIMFGV